MAWREPCSSAPRVARRCTWEGKGRQGEEHVARKGSGNNPFTHKLDASLKRKDARVNPHSCFQPTLAAALAKRDSPARGATSRM